VTPTPSPLFCFPRRSGVVKFRDLLASQIPKPVFDRAVYAPSPGIYRPGLPPFMNSSAIPFPGIFDPTRVQQSMPTLPCTASIRSVDPLNAPLFLLLFRLTPTPTIFFDLETGKSFDLAPSFSFFVLFFLFVPNSRFPFLHLTVLSLPLLCL